MTDNPSLMPHRTLSQSVVKGKPKPKRIGREAYDTLMSFLAEVPEAPTAPHGVFVANSTLRRVRRQIEEQFLP